MATNIPAMRRKMGNTEYYLCTMKVGNLLKQLLSLEKWKDGMNCLYKGIKEISIINV